ncbi:hypothetical protein FHS89_001747 [Rubricella aquisinus]|uniref:UPF0276 protein FHS89_001747 n=1 Tax=Rubricella aquisinus TaxID=2028108 RepID=A0A840X4W4_9RHOB|nr:DUF692 domain-containing protein [Rubricella aquisinus]MBB5515727.1 hypothetical protein [Rubricella aquisinus]
MFDTLTNTIPNRPGVGFKAQHAAEVMARPAALGWVEIHAENYMGDGGPALAQLRALREVYPVSCHGVGLSIGGERPLDTDHLARLRKLVDWLEPALFSEHLAWSTHDSGFLNDLLPLPYTQAAVDRIVSHITQVQDVLGKQMLLENPSTYVAFAQSEMDEITFLREIATRSGCGLLLDVNNVFVSATNQDYDPVAYIDAFPLDHVGEIHLGGHEEDADEVGAPLLIDTHSRPVVPDVWQLYAHTIARGGPRPTLIEWDNDVPDWPVLEAELTRADQVLTHA